MDIMKGSDDLANMEKRVLMDLPVMDKEALNQPIIFVVDMVNGFVKEGALSDLSILHIVEPLKDLLAQIKPNVFVCDAHDLDAREFRSYPIHCVEGTDESKVVSELATYVEKTIYKNSTNTFVSSAFQEMLGEVLHNHRDIVIVGCCTDICIMQFALSLNTFMNEGNLDEHRVIVPVNMIETFHIDEIHEQEKMNEFACNIMLANGIEVVKMR